MTLPGQQPHHPPTAIEQDRLLKLHPYIREANEVFRPTWHIGPRRLFDFLLVHILKGTGRFTVAGNPLDVAQGDVIWIPPNTLHEMYGYAPGTHIQYIHFDLLYNPLRSHWSAHVPGNTTDLTPWPDQMHPPVNDPVIDKWCGKLPAGNPVLVTETLRRIILEFNRNQTSGLIAAGLICQLIGHLLRTHSGSPLTAQQTGIVESAMQQIQRESYQKMKLETLAQQHGLSAPHFRKLFRAHFGQSPREAHFNAKIRTACDFLTHSDLTVSEIADRLGFTNIHNFSRAFRKAMEQSPSTYRNG